MGEVSDRIDNMTVRVTSPDGNLQGAYIGGERLRLKLRPGTYSGYSAPSLAIQCEQLAKLLWTGFTRGYNQVMDEVAGTGQDNDRPEEEWDANRRRFKLARQGVTARAMGNTRLLRAQAVGLFDWKVDIKPEALTKLSEDEFITDLQQVGNGVLNDHSNQVRKLLIRHFDIRYPATN